MCRIRLNKVCSGFIVCLLWAAVMLAGCGNPEQAANSEAEAPARQQGEATAIPGSPSDESLTEEVSIQSGMEIGAIPLPFDVEDVTGPHQGKHLCYRCLYGERPVVGIFVRDLDQNTKTLIQKIDQEVASHQDEKLAAFVVVLTDDPASAKPDLEQVAQDTKIKHVPLTVFEGAAGPAGYNVTNEAAVNVMIWEGEVKANRAYQKGQLNDEGIQEVIADTRLIVQ
ncbi:hypothetical protein [uncultured Gimesia sp.]|uniref:hypothetical protein n=1 Tax=uncultured Gimesia sp. TaxID=1678688 RepID=UPI0030DA7190|tara:strand:- start:234583 stop:235257 length:675 start_codon:yes stop_codon:yes gene_type:complete